MVGRDLCRLRWMGGTFGPDIAPGPPRGAWSACSLDTNASLGLIPRLISGASATTGRFIERWIADVVADEGRGGRSVESRAAPAEVLLYEAIIDLEALGRPLS